MNVVINEKLQIVFAPTINKLIEALEKMEQAGVDRDANLKINHLENSLGNYAISQLFK
jgi:hypothetical protein